MLLELMCEPTPGEVRSLLQKGLAIRLRAILLVFLWVFFVLSVVQAYFCKSRSCLDLAGSCGCAR